MRMNINTGLGLTVVFPEYGNRLHRSVKVRNRRAQIVACLSWVGKGLHETKSHCWVRVVEGAYQIGPG